MEKRRAAWNAPNGVDGLEDFDEGAVDSCGTYKGDEGN